MKKIIFLVCAIVFCVIQYAFAEDMSALAAPTPAQSYHTTQTALQSEPKPSAVSATPQTPLSTASVAQTQLVSQTNNDSAMDSSASQIQLTESQEQLSRRIQELAESNQVMSTAIQSIDQSLSQLQQEINALSKQQAIEQQQWQSQPHNKNNFLSTIPIVTILSSIIAEAKTPIGLGVIAAILLGCALMITRMIMRRADERAFSSGKTVRTAQEKMTRPDALLDEDTKNEYDFMGTREAIPAKLDLARSYMEMNDHDQAYAILKTVMELGNENQRTEAQLLIQKIVKKK